MKIKCANKGIKWIFNREISENRIEFDENHEANVSKEVGEQLLDLYPDLAKAKSKAKSKEE